MTIKFILRQIYSSAADDAVIGEYVFDGSLFSIGSDPGGTIVVPESASEQAVVVEDIDHLTLINGEEGTYLNGRKLQRDAIEPLAVGDEIRIGKYVISVASAAAAAEKNLNGANPQTISPPAPIETLAAEKNPPAAPNGKLEASAKIPARNFADILNTLRTEEDSFYFIVENGTREETRIPLEQSEMPLGFDARGEIAWAIGQIAALYAVVRKDWSGIVVESQRGGAVLVNDETIQTTRRLRNGDRVSFNAKRKDVKKSFSLKLHEPSSLVALESILGNHRAGGENINFGGASGNAAMSDTLAAPPAASVLERNFFGYFSFFEVAAMAIGTLIAAVLIFLLLELFFG